MTTTEDRIEEIRALARSNRLGEVHPSHLMVLILEMDRLRDTLDTARSWVEATPRAFGDRWRDLLGVSTNV